MTKPTRRQLAAALGAAVLVSALAWSWESLDVTVRAAFAGLMTLGLLLVLFASRPEPSVEPRSSLPALLDSLLAVQSKGSLQPTLQPWVHMATGKRPVLLVPAADYHLAEIIPLSAELENLGCETRIAVGVSPWARTRDGLAAYPGIDVYNLPDPDTVKREVSLVVTMKDTGSMSDWVSDVRANGISVLGKVEGAQDFWDADTPDQRRPYRNLDLVLCQGQFDADALSDRGTAIVGSSRLERLWWAPPHEPPPEPLALINLNFVYGVRTEDRKLWLDTAVRGCERAGIPYVVSVHPAERSRLGPNMTRVSASALLPHSSVLISRFSTVPFEAMAQGVPFIYHNPHGETVRTFTDPKLDLATSVSVEQLEAHVARLDAWPYSATETLQRFVDVKLGFRSEVRAADVVQRWLR